MANRTTRLTRALWRVEPPPRTVDQSIFAPVTFETLSGILSLGADHPANGLLFVVHGIAGLSLVVPAGFKLYRVCRRVLDTRLRNHHTALSVPPAVVALASLGTDIAQALGVEIRTGFQTLLNIHVGLGLLVVSVLFFHLWAHFRPPRRIDFTERCRTLQYDAILVFSAVTYRATGTVGALRDAGRRFTGSRPLPPGKSNDVFPVTGRIADDPDPVDPDSWSFLVTGLVDRSLGLDRVDFTSCGTRSVLLNYTSGWYTEQHWTGVRLGDVLDAAGVHSSTRWVTVRSVTDFQWSPLVAEAREMLLATHVDGDPPSHGRGAPLQLVTSNRRGFQWVNVVEVRQQRGPAQ